ncbi:MAG: helix-turn-helix domain-containing protein [Chitinispirillia bacterium]|nr:helix-turn-helix domain-containing protein [Chitinispirillia bacterium]
METLGQRIKYYRKKAGIQQKRLAETLGISASALNYYESDKRQPTAVMLADIAGALNITGDALLGLDLHPDLVAQNRTEFNTLYAIRNLNPAGQKLALDYITSLAETTKYGRKK